jgi:EAL domain-containing protein (putative c-di-GMP-specific phosphodiesterase class I)
MKIDRSFILNIDNEPKKKDMLATVVLLSQPLNFHHRRGD